ncbi:MAG: hypothetical protein MJ211_08025 [Bacteroidales bacterium]|nr:hypothetical protein [Bacteroidales bacterium]
MKKYICFVFCVLLFAISCNNNSNNNNMNYEVTFEPDSSADNDVNYDIEIEYPDPIIPESDTYYNVDSGNALVISNPITYHVNTKNYKPDDEWTEQCLANTKMSVLVNSIYQAVYKGKLIPYDYFSEQPIPIDSVKAFEKKHSRNMVGQLQFVEDWYYDEKQMKFYKNVKSITLGYEIVDKYGLIGFDPGFMVKLKE